MESNKIKWLGAISLMLGIVLIVLAFVFIEDISSPGLCVDGDGDINLEGMMCDKGESFIFGFPMDSWEARLYFITAMLLVLGGWVIVLIRL